MAQTPVRIIFDRGAAPELFAENEGDPDYRGAPQGAFSIEFGQWPPVEQEIFRLYLQPDGTLSPSEPAIEQSASSFLHDPEAGQRTLDRDQATILRPAKTYLETDAAPLTAGEYVEARIEIFPFAHVFRAGSRIRLQIDTPGDSRELWGFVLLEYDQPVTNIIAHSSRYPSSVALPLIPVAEVKSTQPHCPALRGQPCRPFESYTNTPAETER